MEPEEGDYDFDWLDHAIADAAKHHIYVVLGTPTAAPPAWLTQKYPETLRIKEDGRRDEHGNRQQFNWANPKYRELCRGIAEKMAKRYGHNPNVIGWQIDNEYAAESFGPDVQKQFQDWLKARYGTLDNLNARWTTAYWSETYTDWSQIPIEEKVRQSRSAAELEALRLRHLAQLPEEPARCDPRQQRPAPVHHHQHDGLVRRLRSLHRLAGPRSRFVGRLCRPRAISIRTATAPRTT